MDAPLSVLAPLVQVEGLRHVYRQGEGNVLVLDGVDLTLVDNEIVGLLGRSGCGKSTLLRIIAGLMPPTAGIVAIDGEPVRGPASQVAMVFQTFALFPWLTVLDNAEIGLEAQGMPAAERHKRALAAIDLIGLDGYESAYPKELSGGMRQRVGFARALVVHPKVLLMDEPFSALDVLTAETLRTDLLDLWCEGRMEIDDLFPVLETLQLLRFAEVAEGDVRLTEAGMRFARADLDEGKRLFAQHLIAYVPLAAHIKRVLDERASHRAPATRFRDELEDSMPEEQAENTLRALISWARYAE